MGKVVLPRQMSYESRPRQDGTVCLADVLAALMLDDGRNPNNWEHLTRLASEAGLKSAVTLHFILTGKTRRPHRATIRGLIRALCPNRSGSSDLLWIAAGYLPPKTPSS